MTQPASHGSARRRWLVAAVMFLSGLSPSPQPRGTSGAMAGASALTSIAVLIGLGTLAMLAVAALFTWG